MSSCSFCGCFATQYAWSADGPAVNGPPAPGQNSAICKTPQSNGASVGFALAGGIFLCIGNIATQYSLAFVGLSITEVVASSITVVGGASRRLGFCSF